MTTFSTHRRVEVWKEHKENSPSESSCFSSAHRSLFTLVYLTSNTLGPSRVKSARGRISCKTNNPMAMSFLCQLRIKEAQKKARARSPATQRGRPVQIGNFFKLEQLSAGGVADMKWCAEPRRAT